MREFFRHQQDDWGAGPKELALTRQDLGYLESGLCGSLAQLVICNEIVDWISHTMGPIEISDETLALDLIDREVDAAQLVDLHRNIEVERAQPGEIHRLAAEQGL